MKSAVSPTKESRPPSVSWVRRSSISFAPKRNRSGSSPAIPFKSDQPDVPSGLYHMKDLTPIDACTTEHSMSTPTILQPDNTHIAKGSSQSLTLTKDVNEKEDENKNRQKTQLKSAKVTLYKKVRPRSVTWVEQSPIYPQPQQISNENTSPSTTINNHLHEPSERFHVKDLNLLDTLKDNQTKAKSIIYREKNSPRKPNYRSVSPMKNTPEIEQEDQSIKSEFTKLTNAPTRVSISRVRRSSIDSIGNKFQNSNRSETISNNPKNSFVEHNKVGDLTPLNPTIKKNEQAKFFNGHTTKYHFQSSQIMKNISGTREEDQQERLNNRREISQFICHKSNCFKALGCIFAITGCLLAIAALIFAILSYRSTLPGTTITTTTTTSSTSTTSTTTTTTTTTTQTTTSTSSVSTTSTSSTSTSTTTTSTTTMCSTTIMTTTLTLTPLPTSCSNYLSINDTTRLSSYSTGSNASCDQTLFSNTTWVRFTGAGGISLANCPVAVEHCGTNSTGWYSGIYPAVAGGTTAGVVCYNWVKDTCTWQTFIQVTNCNGYYIYALSAPPICNARYCTI